jgi:hypothetical protein
MAVTEWHRVITRQLHDAENKFENTWFEFKTGYVYSKSEVLTGVLMEIQTSRHVNFSKQPDNFQSSTNNHNISTSFTYLQVTSAA